jgi:hypothetical protein
MGTFSLLDTTITGTRLNGTTAKAYVSTRFNVGASSGTGGSIAVQVYYGTHSGGSNSSTVNLTYTGGLDSLDARVIYTNAAANGFTQSNGGSGIFGFAFSQTDLLTASDFTFSTSSPSGDIDTLLLGNGSQGTSTTGITNTGVTTGASNYVTMSRNGFLNQGVCSVALIAASNANTGQAVRHDQLDADFSQSMGVQLRANGDNSKVVTIWSQETLVKAESEDSASDS